MTYTRREVTAAEDETPATKAARDRSRFRWQMAFHVVETVLLLVCTVILIYFVVKYTQFVHGLRDFGDSFNLDPTPTPDCFIPDDPSCIPGG